MDEEETRQEALPEAPPPFSAPLRGYALCEGDPEQARVNRRYEGNPWFRRRD